MVSLWLPKKDIYFLAYYFAVCTLSWHTSTKNGATVGKILLHTLVGLAEDEMEVHETVNGDDLLIGQVQFCFMHDIKSIFYRGALLLNSI